VTVIGFSRIAGAAILAPFTTPSRLAIATVRAVIAILALRAIIGGRFLVHFDQLFLALVLVDFIVALTSLLVLIFEPRPILAQNAEIMVRELQKIFGLDAVARKLRVACHALVFLEQLRRIAALAIVLPVARLSAEVLASLPTTTAPTAALTIIDQMPTSLRSVFKPLRLRQAERRRCAALTLSFRSKREAQSERPIVSGLGQERSSVDLERAWPRTLM
jgi:hypothetical protein